MFSADHQTQRVQAIVTRSMTAHTSRLVNRSSSRLGTKEGIFLCLAVRSTCRPKQNTRTRLWSLLLVSRLRSSFSTLKNSNRGLQALCTCIEYRVFASELLSCTLHTPSMTTTPTFKRGTKRDNQMEPIPKHPCLFSRPSLLRHVETQIIP